MGHGHVTARGLLREFIWAALSVARASAFSRVGRNAFQRGAKRPSSGRAFLRAAPAPDHQTRQIWTHRAPSLLREPFPLPREGQLELGRPLAYRGSVSGLFGRTEGTLRYGLGMPFSGVRRYNTDNEPPKEPYSQGQGPATPSARYQAYAAYASSYLQSASQSLAPSTLWARIVLRLRTFLKGANFNRKWKFDDILALFSWIFVGNAFLILAGTTTFFSVVLWLANSLQFQGRESFDCPRKNGKC